MTRTTASEEEIQFADSALRRLKDGEISFTMNGEFIQTNKQMSRISFHIRRGAKDALGKKVSIKSLPALPKDDTIDEGVTVHISIQGDYVKEGSGPGKGDLGEIVRRLDSDKKNPRLLLEINGELWVAKRLEV